MGENKYDKQKKQLLYLNSKLAKLPLVSALSKSVSDILLAS